MEHIATDAAQTFPQTAPETSFLPRLHMKDIVKDFPGVRALDHVDFEVRAGEIMGLVGENGAGHFVKMVHNGLSMVTCS